LRSSLLTSLIAHAVFLGVIVFPALWTGKTVTMQVMNVKLIAEEKPKPAPPKPEKKPEVVAETKPPEPEKKAEPKMTYKPEKKTTTRKTEQKTETAPKKAEPEKKPSGPAAGSTVRVDDPDFRFAYYLEIIKERVGSNWDPPPISAGGSSTSSVIYFRISRSGGVGDTKVEKKSGYDLFDKAAMRAVKLCDPLPPLPAGFKSKWLGVHFEFEQTSEQP
jgi:protein TonB